MSVSSATISVDPDTQQRLALSRACCAVITRSSAKNFYYGLRLLPEPKRSAMYALYAYMRQVDDIADDETGRTVPQRLAELAHWSQRTRDVSAGATREPEPPPHAADIWPAFSEMAIGYQVPIRLFEDAIEGQCRDLRGEHIGSFRQLQDYCYCVAGVVGLASIHIWGFEGGEETRELAIARGVAFQLTNIIRDIKEDAARGRVYFPADELQDAGITRDEILASTASPKLEAFLRVQIARADDWYRRSADLENRISPDSRPTLRAMTDIYHGILQKAAESPDRVLRERISISTLSKLRIAWRAVRSSKRARAS